MTHGLAMVALLAALLGLAACTPDGPAPGSAEDRSATGGSIRAAVEDVDAARREATVELSSTVAKTALTTSATP